MGFIGPRGDWVSGATPTRHSFGGLIEAAVQVKGDKELRRRLEHVQGPGTAKALYAGIRAGMRPITRALRAAVTASSASQAVKAAARKTVAQRFAKAKRGEYAAKVGFGVGKQAKKQRMTAHERHVYGQGGAKLARGVGISKTNIHWFVLGTDERQLKTPRWVMLNGRRVWVEQTGTIEPVLAGLTDRALATGQGALLAAARQKIAQVISREAAKRQ